MAFGVEENNILINGILFDILAKARLQRPHIPRLGGEVSYGVVGRQKADVGSALIQIAGEDIDHHLRL